jgi:DNA-binding transcriptional regulator YdaS (Cro superfamily)
MARRKRNRKAERLALLKACEAVGGQTALSRKMNLGSQGTVSSWLMRGTPAERVVDIEVATGVPRHELRPDLFDLGPLQQANVGGSESRAAPG